MKDFAFVRSKEVLMCHLLKVRISIRSKMHAEEVKDTLERSQKCFTGGDRTSCYLGGAFVQVWRASH